MSKKIYLLLVFSLLVAGHAKAQNTPIATTVPRNSDLSPIVTVTEMDAKASFKKKQLVVLPNLSTPEVIEVALPNSALPFVYSVNDGIFEPRMLNIVESSGAVSVYRENYVNGQPQIEYLTAESPWDFPLPVNGGDGYGEIYIKPEESTEFSSLVFQVSANSRLPQEIELVASYQGQEAILVARETLTESEVSFPSTAVDFLRLKVYYRQPWRLAAIHSADTQSTSAYSVRFLARPDNQYVFYWDQDWAVSTPVAETTDLSGRVVIGTLGDMIDNEQYRNIDVDGDGVVDSSVNGGLADNCPSIPNPDQADVNNNGVGDVCDDFDRDGVRNNSDNCVDKPNGYQEDEDGDGVGDVCDGEESRLTEKYTWLPWVGIVIAGTVLFALFIIAAKHEMDRSKLEK